MSKARRKKRVVQRKIKTKRTNLVYYGGGLVLLVLALTGTWLVRNNNPENIELATEISVNEAATLRDSGAFVLDVRQPEEWQQYRIPGSTLIPLDQLESRISEIPKNQAIVVVCRQGNRSLEGRDILLKAGFDRVTSMAGGLLQWHGTGYALNVGD